MLFRSKWLAALAFDDISSPGNSTVRVWEAESGRELLTIADTSLQYVSFSPDGTKLATSYVDGTIKVWDIQTKQAIMTFVSGYQGWLNMVFFSPDGSKLVANDTGVEVIIVWDLGSGEKLATLDG